MPPPRLPTLIPSAASRSTSKNVVVQVLTVAAALPSVVAAATPVGAVVASKDGAAVKAAFPRTPVVVDSSRGAASRAMSRPRDVARHKQLDASAGERFHLDYTPSPLPLS